MFISICIPSYNRPRVIQRLLESVDCDPSEVEIVVCEDFSPRREEIRQKINLFKSTSRYRVNYLENPENLGYDGNIRKLIEVASGEFVLFIGDDDRFYPGALDKFIEFMKRNSDVGYVLRSYYGEHPNRTLEMFKYFKKEQRLESSLENCSFLFKRSVSIAGVTFKRSSALAVSTNKFDGTLLYQLYLVLEVAYKKPSVYCDIPVCILAQTYREDKPNFGASNKESKFEPGKVTPSNSIAFTQGFFEISKAFDVNHNTNITKLIRLDLSRYSYPILSIQRKNGFLHFIKYSYQLARKTQINKTWHYYFYVTILALLGEAFCDKMIIYIKNKVGYTPNL